MVAASADPVTVSSAASGHRMVPNTLDPPEHTTFRAIIDPFFTTERMRALEPRVRTIALTLRQHPVDSHTTAEECGRVAAAVGVKTLVLSHLMPSDDPEVTDRVWVDAARRHFQGRVILGKDLLEI